VSKPPTSRKADLLIAPHPLQNVEASADPSWCTKWWKRFLYCERKFAAPGWRS
jgi:hypothetical protein